MARRARMTASSARQQLIAGAAAIFGLSIGIALLPVWLRPAPSSQLPGLMTSLGLDAHASYRFFVSLVALTLAMAAAARPLGRRFVDARQWAAVAVMAALTSSLWIASSKESLLWVVIPPLLVTLAAERLRFTEQQFSRRDFILIPVFLSVFMAVTDIAPTFGFGRRAVLSAMIVLALRAALPFVNSRSVVAPAFCFGLVPLAMFFQSHYVSMADRHHGWVALGISCVTPFLVRVFPFPPRLTAQRVRTVVAMVVYPLVILTYASASSNLAAEGKVHGDLFEDAHNLAVASAMLEGRMPYRDVIPTHGLIQDGLLDFVIMRLGRPTAGHVIAVHGAIGSLVSVFGYAVAAYATGSADVGLLAYFVGSAFNTAGGGLRPAPALLSLAFIVAAVRRRKTNPLRYAGGTLVIAALTSLDYAGYTFVALGFAVLRFPGKLRLAAARAASLGILAGGMVAFLSLAIAGIALTAVRTTLFEILPLAPAYSLPPSAEPEAFRLHSLPPDMLLALENHSGVLIIFWVATLIGVAIGVTLPSRRLIDRWREAILVLGVWVVAAAISYSERRHTYWQLLLAPLLVTAIATLLATRRQRSRWLAGASIVLVTVLAQPSAYLIGLDLRRHARSPFDGSQVEVTDVPRARGALYSPDDAAIIQAAAEYTRGRLAPGETFFDFTNRGALYFLLNRRCPIRQIEVAFYERDDSQRAVIAELSRNPNIRAALVPKNGDVSTMVDAVPNRRRAPLVWSYLEQHFRPDFEKDGVVFWRRVDSR